MRPLAGLLALVLAGCVTTAPETGPAVAQAAEAPADEPLCGPVEVVLAALHDAYGELAVWRGVERRGGLMIRTENPKTDTWTMVIVGPNHAACILLSGDGAQAIDTRGPST